MFLGALFKSKLLLLKYLLWNRSWVFFFSLLNNPLVHNSITGVSEYWSNEVLKKRLYPLVSGLQYVREDSHSLRRGKCTHTNRRLFLSHSSPARPNPQALSPARTLSPSLRRALYWLNESAPKAGSWALWSNPIWFYPIASAGHRGINNKQLCHKCLITQHNLLMAGSCSSSHPLLQTV